ncbi:MAG TPA: Wzz/FepE/Etk N-terminal domain-containing protein [Candidatus Acidoferrum sp.]|jgi:polysaccharide chain length determinant protein (PEP-CTERM system associated)
MVRNGEMSLADIKRVLRRYWWILPITTISLAAIALAAAVVLPKKYTSQTMVLVEQPTVGADYVKPVISEDLNHRLAAMQEQILSRTRLQPIIEKFGLYPKERNRMHMDELVEKLRTTITIKPMEPTPGTTRGQLPGFYVNVTFDNPQLAQQICTEITSMFLAQSAGDRKKQAKVTTDFLSQQLEEAKQSLDEQDEKLAKFKKLNLGSLPEEEQTNLNILTGMNSQLEANTQALSRAQQDKAFNESLLSAQEATWKASQTGQNPETTEQQLTALQDQLTSLESRYTPEHPDVIKLKSQIEQLKKQQAATPKSMAPASGNSQSLTEPPQIQQLRAKLKQNEMSINDLSRRQTQIADQIRHLQGQVQASPMVEQQFKELMRNYQTAQDFYNDLLKKRQNAGVAGDLEGQEESERFQVYDPPSLPDKPSFPKKTYFAGGGMAGGLVLGLGILYLLAASDKSLYNERDVEIALKLPVLTLVPTLNVAASQAKQTLKVLGKSA